MTATKIQNILKRPVRIHDPLQVGPEAVVTQLAQYLDAPNRLWASPGNNVSVDD